VSPKGERTCNEGSTGSPNSGKLTDILTTDRQTYAVEASFPEVLADCEQSLGSPFGRFRLGPGCSLYDLRFRQESLVQARHQLINAVLDGMIPLLRLLS
jgi:hypothetical protein